MENKENYENRVKELAKDMGFAFQISGTTRFGPVAAELVNLRYQKVNAEDIVISKEEYEELKFAKKLLELREETIKYLEDANIRYSEALENKEKETTKKFYDRFNENICYFKLENNSEEYKDGYAQAIADVCGRIDETAIELGVDIKE